MLFKLQTKASPVISSSRAAAASHPPASPALCCPLLPGGDALAGRSGSWHQSLASGRNLFQGQVSLSPAGNQRLRPRSGFLRATKPVFVQRILQGRRLDQPQLHCQGTGKKGSFLAPPGPLLRNCGRGSELGAQCPSCDSDDAIAETLCHPFGNINPGEQALLSYFAGLNF